MYLFLDTETMGLPTRRRAPHTDVAAWPRIVTIGWAFYRSRHDAISRKYHVVKPNGFRVPPAATAIHGISHEEAVRVGQPMTTVLCSLFSEIESFQPTRLICHNIAFDRPVVLAECLRAGFTPHPLESLATYCTKEASTEFCAIPGVVGYKWPTLEELYLKLFGRPPSQSHHAARDVDACAECYFEFTHRVSRSPQAAQGTPRLSSADAASVAKAKELLSRIYGLAQKNPHFDTVFIDSVNSQLKERGFISPKQLAALGNVAKKWKIS